MKCKSITTCAILSMAMAGLAGFLASAAEDPAMLKQEFIFTSAPFPECHASTVVESGGTLVAAWFGGLHEKAPDVGIWVSRLENGNWTVPHEVADGVQNPAKRFPTWNPALIQPASGPLVLFYKVGPDPRQWWGMYKTSEDNGRTWSEAHALPDKILGPIKNKPIQLENGDILSGSSTEHDGWKIHFERCDSALGSWSMTPAVNDPHEISAIQPTLLNHGGNKIEAIGRTRNKRIFEIWSEDGGKTWGPMSLTALPNPDSGIDAVQLRDGRALLVYNHTTRGRSPINVAISPDGKEWHPSLVLENEPGVEYSYPAVIQTADGLVHITYTWKRLRIRHVVLDPKTLPSGNFVDGRWPESTR